LIQAAVGRGASHVAVIAVLTNLPDSESAFNLARQLVHLRLAACVNVLAPATSFYRWEGNEEQASEIPVLIKTAHDRYVELEAAIRKLHPYSLPEIISWPIERGLVQYLQWVERESHDA
jgi:periplasmic divalent cation tolerance protein